MTKVVGVIFKKNGKLYYFNPNGLELKKEDKVVVETERGQQIGIISQTAFELDLERAVAPISSVVRKCSKKDILNDEKNKKDSKLALKKCKDLVEKNKLNMIILEANFNFDRSQLLITFLADSRIDFRKLAKDLANIYKTRIELRQVGVRDKAKEIGGYGCCGRELCCSKFLNDFDSVSINMAKNQNIALNPTKINGICGRLLCCLKYEDECYKECNKNMPKIGKKVETKDGVGKVISVDALKQKYKVEIKDRGIIEVDANESN